MVFGDSLADPVADTILKALRVREEMTDSDISCATTSKVDGLTSTTGLGICLSAVQRIDSVRLISVASIKLHTHSLK